MNAWDFEAAYDALARAVRVEMDATREWIIFEHERKMLFLQELASGVIIGKNDNERLASFWQGQDRQEMYARSLDLELAVEQAKTARAVATLEVEKLRALLRLEEVGKVATSQSD